MKTTLPALSILGLLLLAGCASMQRASQPAPDSSVVALIGEAPITLDAFEQRYARSLGSRDAAADDSLAAYQDFLSRYVNFRLKVRAAKQAGYDTSAAVRKEIADYRSNVARPRLMDDEVLEPILRDLYEKSDQRVDVSHILIRVPPDAPPQDTLEAYRRAQALLDSLGQGADFGALALRHSEDPSAQREGQRGYRGHLGLLSAGQVVKPFEDAAYQTPVGEHSGLVRTRYGYHILHINERQGIPANIRVAHILIRPDGSSPEDTAQALEQINELQAELESGADFAELARQHSEDPASAKRGGALGQPVTPDSRLVAPFKEAAFALDEEGAVSDVVRTRFGFHLIKLLEREERQSYEDARAELKKKAQKLPRMKNASRQLAARIHQEHGVTVDSARVRQAIAAAPADSLLPHLVAGTLPAVGSGDAFATLGDSTYTFRDLSRYLRTQNENPPARRVGPDDVLRLIDYFLNDAAISYEVAALTTNDPEFRSIMREFTDGTLLFQLMEDSVWTAASQDTVGLRAYFQQHRAEYRYPERSRVLSLVSASDSLLRATGERLDAGLSASALAAELETDSTLALRIDTAYVTDSTDAIYNQALKLAEGEHTEPLSYQQHYLLLINDGRLPPRRKTFKEARSAVVNDYQNVLEEQLINRLREKYRVRLYPEHLTQAFADARTTSTAQAAP